MRASRLAPRPADLEFLPTSPLPSVHLGLWCNQQAALRLTSVLFKGRKKKTLLLFKRIEIEFLSPFRADSLKVWKFWFKAWWWEVTGKEIPFSCLPVTHFSSQLGCPRKNSQLRIEALRGVLNGLIYLLCVWQASHFSSSGHISSIQKAKTQALWLSGVLARYTKGVDSYHSSQTQCS